MLEAFIAFLVLSVLIAIFSYLNSRVWRKSLLLFKNPRKVYLIVMCPGTVVHELSHALVSIALLVPVRRIRLYTPFSAEENGTLGQVETLGGGPIRRGLISFAPFIVGLGGMVCLLYFLGGVSFSITSAHELPKALSGFVATPWVLPLLLVCWVLALAMLPSKTDIKNALIFTVVFIVAMGFCIYVISTSKSLETKASLANGFWTLDGFLLLLLVFLFVTAGLLWMLVIKQPRKVRLQR